MVDRRSAACLAVGSELLGERWLDTNSLLVTRSLARCGVVVVEKRVVGDDAGAIARAVTELLRHVDLVVVTGGLGPTADDVTRDGVAMALGRGLGHSCEAEQWIRERYAALKREMPPLAQVMASMVDGARAVHNSKGSAPGMVIEVGERLLVVFPGVPWEMEAMLERDLEPELARRWPGGRRAVRTLLLSGVIESEIEARVSHLYDRFGRENITILASPGVVRLVLSCTVAREGGAGELKAMEAAFRSVLGEDLAAVDRDSLEEAVLDQLRRAGATLATAESCTGGLLSARLTEVAGASDVLLGGIVCYSNRAKEELLGVPHELLVAHGAVSEEVARAMAGGARERLGTDWGVGITGIAGPAGGTADKPVGLVHWAVAGPGGVWHRERVFAGGRAATRQWSANAALDLLRRVHQGLDQGARAT